jgi:hypothetical protein
MAAGNEGKMKSPNRKSLDRKIIRTLALGGIIYTGGGLMKQLVLLPAVLALALATASAQIQSGYGGMQTNGIPASVTSPRPGNPFPGIPASVTSLRNPAVSSGHFQAVPFGHHDFDRDGDFDRNRGHHHHPHLNNFGYGYLYPYVYPYYDESEYADQQQYQQPQQQPEAAAQTVFENRPGYKAPAPQITEQAPEKTAEQAPEPDEPATLLVFKDGRQLEIGNYAIVGDTLYSVADQRSYKIPLAQLDVPATIKANEDRGIEFHLPKKSA